MTARSRICPALLTVLACAASALAADSPPEVPATRSDLKAFLDASKQNVPRLPLPPLSQADKAAMAKADWSGSDWSIYNNGRMRKYYLPAELADVSNLRADDPAMTLGSRFQTMLFWIVSRANNCAYCMGHQESKLTAAGLLDDQIAALDGDWSAFSEKDRAAFTLARKLTYEPHRLTDADIAAAKRFYTDVQVLEIIFAVGNFNAMNRWTGGMKIPQEEHRVYLTPTAPRYSSLRSLVAPLAADTSGSASATAAPSYRPPLESPEAVEAALAACRARTPRLSLVDEDRARALLPGDWPAGPLPQWVRLLANFPEAGVARIAMHRAAEEKGSLDRRLRAEVAYVAARRDRAWYALGHARRRLESLGLPAAEIAALDGPWDSFDPARRSALTLARKLTVDPARITDADVASVREHYPDREVAELIHQVSEAAFFDRVTEAVGLPLEP
jgi:alkylhydroperoxidase family enzyme